MTVIAKNFVFDAAHCIPHHQGKCSRPHGHTYRVEVVVEGDVQVDGPEAGMVVDFGALSAIWKQSLEPLLDHQDLNVTLAEPGHVRWTTAEEIAAWILDVFLEELQTDSAEVVAVKVWETPTAYAIAEAA